MKARHKIVLGDFHFTLLAYISWLEHCRCFEGCGLRQHRSCPS